MPAKELTDEQKADAARLQSFFQAWQSAQRKIKKPWSQEHAAELLGFGQSAFSQYVTGKIPLNAPALWKFCTLLGVKPEDVSPTLALEEAERARRYGADGSPGTPPLPEIKAPTAPGGEANAARPIGQLFVDLGAALKGTSEATRNAILALFQSIVRDPDTAAEVAVQAQGLLDAAKQRAA